MRPRRLSPRGVLFLVYFFLALILIFRKQIKDLCSFNLQKLETYKYNFFAVSNPEVMKRQRPISTDRVEAELTVSIGEPFQKFSQEEWGRFWDVIYGIYPLEKQENAALPNKMRQLTDEEIITTLISLYPRPFAFFQKENWGAFFSLILSQ